MNSGWQRSCYPLLKYSLCFGPEFELLVVKQLPWHVVMSPSLAASRAIFSCFGGSSPSRPTAAVLATALQPSRLVGAKAGFADVAEDLGEDVYELRALAQRVAALRLPFGFVSPIRREQPLDRVCNNPATRHAPTSARRSGSAATIGACGISLFGVARLTPRRYWRSPPSTAGNNAAAPRRHRRRSRSGGRAAAIRSGSSPAAS